MRQNKPSHTAFHMALIRAAHQLLDTPLVLTDPVAVALVGKENEARILAGGRRFGLHLQRSLRAFAVARSRIVEDELAQAVARGVRQFVILGAGMDTFAYRNPYAEQQLRVFEVDHPDTQAMKRQCLAAAGISEPGTVRYVAVNFETQRLEDRLRAAGYQSAAPALFSWLGVSMYLPLPAIQAILGFVGAGAPGSGIVLDYVAPLSSAPLATRLRLRVLTGLLALKGEPWRTYFEPAALSDLLTTLGFHHTENLDSTGINIRFFDGRRDQLRVRGPGHVMVAQV